MRITKYNGLRFWPHPGAVVRFAMRIGVLAAGEVVVADVEARS